MLVACGSRNPDGFSGTVQAPSAAVGSTIGGTVIAFRVRDGSRVRAGEVIVEFDAAQEFATYRNTLASARSAQAALADLAAGSRAPDPERAKVLAQQQRQTYEKAQLGLVKPSGGSASICGLDVASQGDKVRRRRLQKVWALAAQVPTTHLTSALAVPLKQQI